MNDINDFLIEIMNDEISVNTLLTRVKILTYSLDNKEVKEWIHKELHGYDEDDILPKYRISRGVVLGNFVVNSVVQYTNTSIPFDSTRLEPEMVEVLKKIEFRDNIKVLESYADAHRKDPNYILSKPVPTDLTHSICPNPYELQITHMKVNFSMGDIEAALEIVKQICIDILLSIRDFIKDEGIELSDFLSKKPDNSDIIVNKIEIILEDNSIEIGDNNVIKNSKFD